MDKLRSAIREGLYLLDARVRDIDEAIHVAVSLLEEKNVLSPQQRAQVEEALLEREHAASTVLGMSVAAPHAYLDELPGQAIVFVRLARPLNLGAPDGIATRFLFLLLGRTGEAAQHIDTLAAIARLMSDDEFRYEAGRAAGGDDLLEALDHFVQRTSRPVKPVKPAVSESLEYTGRLFGGILADIRRRTPHFADDFRAGLNSKALSATLFLFFACLAPAVIFGGIMAELTGGQIGAVEMILASAFCGVVYALFSGQPLIILGGTGPLLIFTVVLYDLCGDMNIPFLESFAWVGVWTGVFVLLMAATDLSFLIRFFTRFTDEVFAALISLIFIYEAVAEIFHIFHDVEEKGNHDTALLTLLLALGTFYIAMSLSRFRRSRYLLPFMREFLADFGPTIALVLMTLVAFWLHGVDLKMLQAPETFATTAGRAWLLDLTKPPVWVWFAAMGPALLGTLLVFMDQNITARLINSPSHRLHKGEAYHLDLAVVGVLIAICSVFGLPWLVAATVRSLNHLRALATTDEVVTQDGGTRERVIHVNENRVTGLAIHLLIGASLLLLPYLRNIPMAVLYGLFLFMGVVSMSGNQFFERLSLWFMDANLYPSTHYTRQVPRWTIHKFTLLQVVCLGALWFVKTNKISAVAILFPLIIALLVPIRILATRWFNREHLEILDQEEEPESEADRRTE